MNRLYNLQAELDTRDFYRRGTSDNPGVNRYGRLARARNNMLRQRGYTDVQNYTNDDSILLTRKQLSRLDKIKSPKSRVTYINNLYEGNSNG